MTDQTEREALPRGRDRFPDEWRVFREDTTYIQPDLWPQEMGTAWDYFLHGVNYGRATPRPTPHVVTTVEELRHLDGHALRLRCGWVVVVEVLADATNLVHGDHVTDVLVWLNEDDGEGLFPATVLTPAPAPVGREALEIRVEDAVRAAMESRQGGLTIAHGRTWGDPDDYWITMHVGPVTCAVLDAIEGVSRG